MDIWAEFVSSCITEAQARQKILTNLAAGTTPCAGPGAYNAYSGNGNIVGDSVKAALLARPGLEKAENEIKW
ncbi:hypothetical protein [Enterobacter hormaechei]